MSCTERQKRVIKKANEICSKYPWYSGGVCTDRLPSDKEIRENFDKAVNTVVEDTIYWDATGWSSK